MSNLIKPFDPLEAGAELAIRQLPYGGSVIDAYRYFQNTRAHLFLTQLNLEGESLSGPDAGKLKDFVESDIGRDLLAEFAANAVSTSSRVAAVVLGIVYARCSAGKLEAEAAQRICSSLDGADDLIVDHFLLLCDRPEEDEANKEYPDAPYKTTILSQSVIDSEFAGRLTATDAISSVNELIRRRLFLPDYTFDRATPGHWTSIYGLSDTGQVVRDLVIEAKEALQNGTE